jgi:hypothetical protein
VSRCAEERGAYDINHREDGIERKRSFNPLTRDPYRRVISPPKRPVILPSGATVTELSWTPHIYCVWTATLVEPRTTAFASLNSTKMRLVAGEKGTTPLAVAKIAKVGVALALIVVVTLDAGDARHCPEVGLVWQRLIANGSVADPVFAVAVIAALSPTLTVATANALEPDLPAM